MSAEEAPHTYFPVVKGSPQKTMLCPMCGKRSYSGHVTNKETQVLINNRFFILFTFYILEIKGALLHPLQSQ